MRVYLVLSAIDDLDDLVGFEPAEEVGARDVGRKRALETLGDCITVLK